MPLPRVRSLARLCTPAERCGNCGFIFRREPGYYFGVLTPLLPILALATGLVFVACFYLLARPSDPMQLILPGAIGTAAGIVLWFRPAIAIFISLDHAIDPPDQEE